MKIEVIDWVEWDSDYEESLTAMGGWFNWVRKGMRWEDYLNSWREEVRPYIESARKVILDSSLRYTGWDHQHLDNGVPLFSDNTVIRLSQRAWGDLMAAIYSEKENKDYSYMDFYC